jgi:hypothetical protein
MTNPYHVNYIDICLTILSFACTISEPNLQPPGTPPTINAVIITTVELIELNPILRSINCYLRDRDDDILLARLESNFVLPYLFHNNILIMSGSAEAN